MTRPALLCLLLVACGPHAARHAPEHGSTRQGGPDSATVSMVDAPGTASGHGFNYSTDREQPFR